MLYDQITAELEIRAIAKELEPSLQCTIAYDRRKTMRVTIGDTAAKAVVELAGQRLVSTFGLSSNPCRIEPARRATIVIDFNTTTKAARSTFAWAKSRFGGALTGVAVAERTVVAPSTDRMGKFEAGERLTYAYVGDARHSLWRDAAGRITVLDS